MIQDLYESNLVSTIEKSGLTFLIPAVDTSYDDDECVGHEEQFIFEEYQHDPSGWDNVLDEYQGDVDALIRDRCKLEGIDPPEDRIHNLDELMIMFGEDMADPEEFIIRNIWDLLGLTLPQFKMVPVDYLGYDNFYKFLTVLKSSDLPVENRIKWAVCCAVTDCNKYATGDAREHCKHIACLYDVPKAVDCLKLYLDYIRFLSAARIMNNRRMENGGPVFDYETCPKPSHIKDLHDKAYRDYMAYEAEKAAEERELLDAAIKDASENPLYKKFLYKNGQFEIVSPKTFADFEYEGEYLRHCVASYAEQFGKLETFIYFIRRSEHPDRPFYTAEVVYDEQSKVYFLSQCYTFDDSTKKDAACREFINEWCHRYNIKIHCEV